MSWMAAGTLLALALGTRPAFAEDRRPPVVTDADRMQAQRVARMSDSDPTARLLLVLEARDLSRAALFELASSHPSIAEQLVNPEYKVAIDYIATLPPPELHRIRQGETIVRGDAVLRNRERDAAVAIAERFDFPKFDPDKITAVRLGPVEGRLYRIELAYQHKKKQRLLGNIDLAWPSTPERDESIRTDLTRHFGARPSASILGSGSVIPMAEGSFEAPDSLTTHWTIRDSVRLVPGYPHGEVALDDTVALDGLQSLRFHNTEATRQFSSVGQAIAIAPGTRVRVQCQFRANNLRAEYLQREDLVGLSLTWVDPAGVAIGSPIRATGRLLTHAWEPMEVEATAPAGAASAYIELSSSVSGTAWFDGVHIERR